jgi:hypothetical protein
MNSRDGCLTLWFYKSSFVDLSKQILSFCSPSVRIQKAPQRKRPLHTQKWLMTYTGVGWLCFPSNGDDLSNGCLLSYKFDSIDLADGSQDSSVIEVFLQSVRYRFCCRTKKNYYPPLFFFLSVLAIKLTASCLLGKFSTTWATPQSFCF